jgi:predicted O-methyltransferase YrrM
MSVTMALDARHRSSLYLKFVPLIGEDDANALMSEFPASEAEELVTKQFLRAELAELENRLTVRLGAALGVSTAILATLISIQ